MDREDIHPSHVMEDNDYGDDNHCPESCKNCHLTHCYLCPTGWGMDDDELAVTCMGYPWYDQYFVGDKPIGRKSKTGWF